MRRWCEGRGGVKREGMRRCEERGDEVRCVKGEGMRWCEGRGDEVV